MQWLEKRYTFYPVQQDPMGKEFSVKSIHSHLKSKALPAQGLENMSLSHKLRQLKS